MDTAKPVTTTTNTTPKTTGGVLPLSLLSTTVEAKELILINITYI